jgi:hypothetical protein
LRNFTRRHFSEAKIRGDARRITRAAQIARGLRSRGHRRRALWKPRRCRHLALPPGSKRGCSRSHGLLAAEHAQGHETALALGASHIADPAGEFSLDNYIRMNGVTRSEAVSARKFVRYGQWFQRKAA